MPALFKQPKLNTEYRKWQKISRYRYRKIQSINYNLRARGSRKIGIIQTNNSDDDNNTFSGDKMVRSVFFRVYSLPLPVPYFILPFVVTFV